MGPYTLPIMDKELQFPMVCRLMIFLADVNQQGPSLALLYNREAHGIRGPLRR